MIIGIDFDGTCVTHEFPKVGKDIGAVPILKRLANNGHKLVLNTMRSDLQSIYNEELVLFNTVRNKLNPVASSVLDDARIWFNKNEIPLYGINSCPGQKEWTSSTKTYAELYIDDASLGCPLIRDPKLSDRPFVDWNAVEKLLEKSNLI